MHYLPLTVYVGLLFVIPQEIPVVEAATPLSVLNNNHSCVLGLAFSANGKYLASAGEAQSLNVWDLEQYKLRSHFIVRPRDDFAYIGVSFLSDHRTLVAANERGVIQSWELGKHTPTQDLTRAGPPYPAIAVSPDGTTVAYTADKQIHLWSVAKEASEITIPTASPRLTRLHYLRDGKHLVAGDHDGKVVVWEIPTKQRKIAIREQESAIEAIESTDDQKYLIIAYANNVVTALEAGTGKSLHTFQGKHFVPTRDSRSIILHGVDGFTIQSLATGKVEVEIRTRLHFVRAMALSPDGTRLAVGTDTGAVHIWDTTPWLKKR